MLSQYHEMSATGCVSSQDPIFDRALVRTRPTRDELCARVSILQFWFQGGRNFHCECMIAKPEIRTFTFWKGLTPFWKRHSALLSPTIRRVTRDRLGRGRQYRVGIGCGLKRQIKSFAKSSNQTDGPYSAAAYVRMSTDLQKYSTENQLQTIRRYAEQRGYTIVRIFED